MPTGIYKITNKNTGEVYIGQAINIKRRIEEHKQKRFVPIDMIINIIGVENFNFEIIEECPVDELDEKEVYYIDLYNSKNKGYNKQNGGFNNSIGEGNGRAKLSEQDVTAIRIAYKNHASPKKEYEKYKDKISLSQFQAIWQGKSWSHIMPEVFTENNKQYYSSIQFQEKNSISLKDLFKYRQFYVTHTCKETYAEYLKDISFSPNLLVKESTFIKILIGDVKANSIYLQIPVYKKKQKRWELNNEPVQTIPESWK